VINYFIQRYGENSILTHITSYYQRPICIFDGPLWALGATLNVRCLS